MQKLLTLVLSSLNNGSEKAVANFEIKENNFFGKVRLYNFKNKPEGILTLGVLSDGKVLKTALKEIDNNLYAFESVEKLPKHAFTCAIVNVKNGDAKPLLLGATNGVNPKTLEHKLAENLFILDEIPVSMEKVENVLDDANIDFVPEEKKEIERKIACELGGNEKCAECKYREAFFANCESQDVNKRQNKIEIVQEENFYSEVKEQIESLFERYPEETFLNEVVPNSKWIKVDYENDGQYYVIGLIFENDKIKYICYGVPGEFDVLPPEELSKNAQWLPLDPQKPEDLGYWITYQDAENGENVEVDVS